MASYTHQSIEGIDDINLALNKAMYQTLVAMEAEGIITEEVAYKFADEHIAQMANPTAFARLFKVMGLNKDGDSIIISKVVNK